MRALAVAVGVIECLGLGGCSGGACAPSDTSCRVASPCPSLAWQCGALDGGAAPASLLEVRTLDGHEAERGQLGRPRGPDALGARGDVLLANDRVVAVISAIGDQNYLDPNGGSLLDLAARDNLVDGLNEVVVGVGLLPRDQPEYTRLTLLDERPVDVAVQLDGTLRGRPDVPVHTRFELRPCEPGVRMRSEIANGEDEPQAWTLTDGYYWSLRSELPFTPTAGQGFAHPSFGLTSINDAFSRAPLFAAATHYGTAASDGASYAAVACGGPELEGIHSEFISLFGMPRAVVEPRGGVVFERFLAVAPRADVASATDLALEARRQLRGEAWVTLRGRVEGGGVLDDERRASLLVVETPKGAGASPDTSDAGLARRTPWTQIVPASDGTFSARVPTNRDLTVELWGFGRKLLEEPVRVDTSDVDVGRIDYPAITGAVVSVTDDAGAALDAEVFVVPADDATRARSAGSLHGQFDTCAPWLGPPPGASPACNRVLFWHRDPAPQIVPLADGSYHLYATHGPFYSLGHALITVGAGLPAPRAALTLHPLALKPRGALSADLHVHGANSFDSSIPDLDRVLSFATADVDVIIATDHDIVSDYAEVARRLDLDARLSTVSGVETTGHVPFLAVPGDPFPRVIGHYNFWPLRFDPSRPRNGGPFDEFVEPGALFDAVEPLFTSSVPIVQLNHPWSDAIFGRDLGYPRALALDLTRDLPLENDGTNEGLYVKTPNPGGRSSASQDTIEVMNGTPLPQYLQHRAFWMYSLLEGKVATGTANSDSHGLTDNTLGTPRNLVFTSATKGPGFAIDTFDQALRDGSVLGTNGPVVTATVTGRDGAEHSFGTRPLAPAPNAMVTVEVDAAPWVPVDEVRFIVNRVDGAPVMTVAATSPQPSDPFGTGGLVRYMGRVPLASLLAGVPAGKDAWLVVEAGAKLPLAGDLGGGRDTSKQARGAKDGVPDTTDNNHDGVVDERDLADPNSVGPLANPPLPTDASDPRYPFAQVVTDGYAAAFTNPFLLDLDGNGSFDAPGVAGIATLGGGK